MRVKVSSLSEVKYIGKTWVNLITLNLEDPIPVLAPTPMETEEKEVPKGTIPEIVEGLPDIFKLRALPTTIEVFCRVGGFGLLSKHLPVVYPDTLRQMAVGGSRVGSGGGMTNLEKDTPMVVHDNDWVKVENPDDFYDVRLGRGTCGGHS